MRSGQVNFHMPPLSPLNKIIICIVAGLFLINTITTQFASFSLVSISGLSAVSFFKGFIFQIFTYPLVATSLFEVLFDCLIIWFIGSELEAMWGGRRYLSFIFTSSFIGGIVFVLFQFLFYKGTQGYFAYFSGIGGVCSALLVAYGILFPERILYLIVFPVKARYFCMIIIAMQLFTGIFSNSGTIAWGYLGSMLGGFLFMLAVSNPKFKNLFIKNEYKSSSKSKSSHLKLIKTEDGSEDDDSPKYWQ